MGFPVGEAVERLQALDGVGSVTRGHPKGSCRLPCIEIKQTGRRTIRSYDDLDYLTRYELTINLYAKSLDELDALEQGTVETLQGMGFALENAVEQTGEDVCQKTLRLNREQ